MTTKFVPWTLGIAAIAGICACGEIAIDGLRNGEVRSTILPVAPPQDGSGSPDIPARIFRGETAEAVTIGRGEHALFVAQDADGMPAVPVFDAPVTVEAGATLIGSAKFSQGLVIKGERDHPVIWQLDGSLASAVTNASIEWANIVGGALNLSVQKGHLAVLRSTELSALSLGVLTDTDAKIEISWSKISDCALAVHYPAQAFEGGNDAAVQALWRFASNEVNFTSVSFAEKVISQRVHEIEANNFDEPRGDLRYFNASVTEDDVLRYAGNSNYFLVKEKLINIVPDNRDPSFRLASDMPLDARTFDWITKPFVTGPGNDQIPVRTRLKSGLGVRLQLITIGGGSYGYFYLSNSHFGASSYTFSNAARSYLEAKLLNFSMFVGDKVDLKKEKALDPVLDVAIEEPKGCSQEDPQTSWYQCPASYTFDFTFSMKVGGKLVDTFVVTQPFTSTQGGHIQRQIEIAMLGALGRLMDDGKIVDIPSMTPYF